VLVSVMIYSLSGGEYLCRSEWRLIDDFVDVGLNTVTERRRRVYERLHIHTDIHSHYYQ